MRFYLDAHIHSKYSRATSRNLNLENLSLWANKKGITVLGTGDFTHPAWFDEISNKLIPAEPGLFRLLPEIEKQIAEQVKAYIPTRFMLTVEISTIYKKGDKTRKIHHVIYAQDLLAASRINTRLDKIGNIKADGRPILGLDSRDLLEIILEAGTDNYLIPAHIWTPWFAVLGSKSGFDSIEECYGDLAKHIFALETGLSSDPEMNWRVSSLDKYRLVSNSDAHSPAKLGREATLFNTELNYVSIKKALETGAGYIGTVEFFPEEGKYHLDGHRNCNLCLTPEETLKHNGICPICGGIITVGVEHRVNALADKKEKIIMPPKTAGKVYSLVPLQEILAEINQKGVSTKTVQNDYEKLISSLGPELTILQSAPLEDIKNQHSTLLQEAIKRLRAGKVIKQAGFDGEYGIIKLFQEGEIAKEKSGNTLFDFSNDIKAKKQNKKIAGKAKVTNKPNNKKKSINELDKEQKRAVATTEGPILVIAGPGSGKTRTLTYRIAHLIQANNIKPNNILAITFTKHAAKEMRTRLQEMLPTQSKQIAIHTFHSLCYDILRQHSMKNLQIADDITRIKILKEHLNLSERQAKQQLKKISELKREARNDETLNIYQEKMREVGLLDFDDLIISTIKLLSTNLNLLKNYLQQYRYISIDEYQDIDELQYQLIKLLAPENSNLCAIGDPNQAIYKFRGSDPKYFNNFTADYPSAKVFSLKHNYRSTTTIVKAANQILADNTISMLGDAGDKITIHVAKTDKEEAEFIVKTITKLIGGHDFFAIDSKRSQGLQTNLCFADFTILYRTKSQAELIATALHRSGMPFISYNEEHIANQEITQHLLQMLKNGNSNEPLEDKIKNLSQDNTFDAAIINSKIHQLSAIAKLVNFNQTKFYNEINFITEADTRIENSDNISLMTLHAAKGLEFKIVFMVGLEEGMMPFYFANEKNADLEEEQRIFYVGITRAKEKLYLSRAEKRLIHGKISSQRPSRYLNKIEEKLLELSKSKLMKQSKKSKQLALDL